MAESDVCLLDAHQRAESLVLRALVAEHLPDGAPSIKSLLEHLDTTDFDADEAGQCRTSPRHAAGPSATCIC